MKFFESEIYFDSIFRTTYSRDCPRGSGYCEDQIKYNRMNRRIKLFFGALTFSYTIDTEVVPADVWISLGSLGYCDTEWRSKWQDHPNFRKK